MYLEYFSLTRHPFRITPDTSLFYSGGAEGRGVILDAMLYAIETGEGILKVVGEVGSGKTMLCRMLEERLPETTEVVYLANPNLSAEDILYAVAFELKLPIRRDTTKLLVMQQLQNYLLEQHSQNRKVLVVIEEAQGMPLETLEEIRLFSNLETNRDKLMQIILFGQPELDKNLSAKHIRQLRERITHSFYLNPLSAEQAGDYIRFRLGAAGCPCPNLFTPGAEWLLSRASGGLTRRINILADKALLAAFADNVLESPENLSPDVPPVVTWRHVMAAIRDSEYSAFALKTLFSNLKIAGASALVVMSILGFTFWPTTIGQANQIRDDILPIEPPILAVEPEVEALDNAQPEPAELLATEISVVESVEVEIDSVPLLKDETNQTDVAAAVEPVEHAEQEVVENAVEQLPQVAAKNLAQERIVASIEWLRNANQNGYTIQFMSGDTQDMDSAENFLAELMAADLLDESYVCMSIFEGRSYWTIKHGSFAGLSVAQNYIDNLPSQLFDYQPFVQNISSVECNANSSLAALILE